MEKNDNVILVKRENGVVTLSYKDFKTLAYVGKEGFTKDKKEGDWKTPVGEFDLGVAFGKHDKEETKINKDIPYFKLDDSYYWVDDMGSDNYNKLIKSEGNPGVSAEHLNDYANDAYEYAMEIKTNPDNIKGNGSAIFLHINRKEYTAGCVAISKKDMEKLMSMIDSNTKIKIEDLDAEKKVKKVVM